MKKNKLFVVLGREDSRSSGCYYRHAQVDVLREGEYGRTVRLFSVRWQCDSDTNAKAGWYGGRISVETDRSSEALEVFTLAAGFLRKHPITVEPLEWFRSLGLERRVYDGRVSEFVRVEDAAPADHVRWCAMVSGSCAVAVLAPRGDEEVARKALVREFAERIAAKDGYGYDYSSRLEDWIGQGKRVEVAYGRAPEVKTEAEVFETFAPVAVALEEAA